MRLISARSGTRRNSRFLGLPGCGSPVTVPISTWSKPSIDMPSMRDGVLVEAGGEPEGAVHPQPEGLGAQLLVAGRERGGDEGAQDGDAGGEPDPAEGQVVGLLRVHPLEDQMEEELVHESVSSELEEGDTVSGVPLAGC